MEASKLSNPAVIGLGGFGMTTMMLQFHNLDLIGIGPILCLGLVFGGTAQLIAGLLEFKKGNNFGTCAFTAYGAFWISLCFLLIFQAIAKTAAVADSPIVKLMSFDATDLAYFLAVWGAFTGILFIASLKHNFVLSMIFLTLTLGFFGLAAADFGYGHIFKTLAAYDLLGCAALAWYGMASVVYGESGIKLPMGKALWK